MEIYYIQVKDTSKKPDVCWWEGEIKTVDGVFGCLAFFKDKTFALKYLRYLQEDNEFDIEYEIKSTTI